MISPGGHRVRAYDGAVSEGIAGMDGKRARVRLFVAADLAAGGAVALAPEQAHYVSRVMRLGIGDRLLLFNGRHGEWLAEIVETTKTRVGVRIERQTREQTSEPGPWLAFAPLKKAETVFLVEKATELGVERLMPVATRRTASERVNVPRLIANAVEAAEQCERLTVPAVDEPTTLSRLLADWPRRRTLFVGDEQGGGEPLIDVLMATRARAPEIAPSHGFLIGPEGGFEREELDGLCDLPFVTRVGLGPRILRAETAAIAALACWQAIVGDGSRPPRASSER